MNLQSGYFKGVLKLNELVIEGLCLGKHGIDLHMLGMAQRVIVAPIVSTIPIVHRLVQPIKPFKH